MKKVILIILAVMLLVPFAHAEEELLDRVVAVVNDDVITQAELDAFLRPLYEDYSQQYSGEELMDLLKDARSKLLNQLIEDRLVYQEAMDQGLEITAGEIDEELDSFKSRIEAREDMETLLAREGLTMKAFREKLKKQVMVRKLQDREVRSKVVISPLEIEEFYKKNPDKFKSQGRVKIRSLTIKKSAEAREKGIKDEKALYDIKTLHRKIEQGADFEELITEFSEDSRAKNSKPSEWIERGTMIESVDEALFNAPVGQLTGIVESPIGYHIFLIREKEDANAYSFEEARDQIMNYLYQVKSNERFKAWMQGLKRDAYISIR